MALRLHVIDELVLSLDPVRIKQAVANLIDNAVKYTPRGGTVDVEIYRQNQDAVISVRDTGVGIPLSETQHIWDRLYRSDRSRSKPGQGLGLSLVKAIAVAHGGDVRVQSEPGKGAQFILSVPLDREST